MTALIVRDLVAGYVPGMPILNRAGVTVAPGEIVAVVGPNGAGKSTLLKAIAGLVPIASGSIALGTRDIAGLPTHAMIRAGVAFVPQTRNVFNTLTVHENLLLGAQALPGRRHDAQMARIYALFADLHPHRNERARNLSGGQRQLLALARALIAEPTVLMLDEPSAGLAPRMVALVLERLRTLARTGVAILVVEQNVKAILGVADRATVLVEGQNRLTGAAAELRADPAVARLYLGGAAA